MLDRQAVDSTLPGGPTVPRPAIGDASGQRSESRFWDRFSFRDVPCCTDSDLESESGGSASTRSELVVRHDTAEEFDADIRA